MLTSWWARTLTWIYLIGYWLYVLVAAIIAWPQSSWVGWTVQVLFYDMTLGMIWPIMLPIKWAAGHW